MRIMRFDTVTGMVNIETFIPPVIPIKNRPGTLVSTYFPADGNGMDEATASNLSFSYLGYVPIVSGPIELVSCGTPNNGAGDKVRAGSTLIARQPVSASVSMPGQTRITGHCSRPARRHKSCPA